MKITITTKEKNIEIANFLLKQAYESAKGNAPLLAMWGITPKQLEKAELFRHELLKAFLNPITEDGKLV